MIVCLPAYIKRARHVLSAMVLLCCTVSSVHGQINKLSGTWAGDYRLLNALNFKITIDLTQLGNSLTGSAKIYSNMDSNYVVFKLEGLVKGDSITLNDITILKHNSSNPSNWCQKVTKGVMALQNDSLVIIADARPTGFGFGTSNELRRVTDCKWASLKLGKVGRSIVQASPLSIQQLPPVTPVSGSLTKTVRSNPQTVRMAITDRGIIDQDKISILYNGKPLLDVKGRPLTDVVITASPYFADVLISSQSENKLEVISVSSGRSETSTVLIRLWNMHTRRSRLYSLNCSPEKNAVLFLKPDTT